MILRSVMIEIHIPEYPESLCLEHLMLDYNGTLAVDGKLINGVSEKLQTLSAHLTIHVVTADTFGLTKEQMKAIPCHIEILSAGNQAEKKAEYLKRLGTHKTVCIGNGANDQEMLKYAALGIAVIQEEGAAVASLMAADVVCQSIHHALDLLLYPQRLIATLRR